MSALHPELLAAWREESASCPSPISLDRKVIELVDEVIHLRRQRDSLHEANNRLLEQRRAAQASAAEAEAELEQITEDLRGMHAEFLERFNTGGQTGICGWCGAPWPTPEAARDHAVQCEKNPAVQRATAAERVAEAAAKLMGDRIIDVKLPGGAVARSATRCLCGCDPDAEALLAALAEWRKP